MPFTPPELLAFLNNTHLFRSIPDDKLLALAAQMELVNLPKDKLLFQQGARADSFYVILKGKMRVVHYDAPNRSRKLATLVEGDYFGEEGMLKKGRRTASIYADTDAILLRIGRKRFERLLKDFPVLRDNLQVAVQSHHLSRSHHLEWLNPDEVVYIMLRKHPFFLTLGIIAPVLIMLAGIGMLALAFSVFSNATIPLICGGLWYLAALLFLAWQIVDWSNDYYIVTNQRVVWMERIALLYDSRQEAPLSTLLSVGIESSQLGRIIGYGNVIVRTFTGPIVLHRVGFPERVASMVEEYWTRAKTTNRDVEARKMEEAIKRRLGLLPPEAQGGAPAGPRQTFKAGWLQRAFANFFRMRFEQGEVITYRKHWYILISHTWKQIIFYSLGLAVLILRAYGFASFISWGAMWLLMGVYFLGVSLWYLYDYIDWRNDIYQVTGEQIVDIERKPLGKEEKKSAPLENILSIEYQRLGIVGLLLNFGTVTITVGGTKFTFDYVYDPSTVQQELFRRMNERVQKKKERELAAERERVSEWIATYHRSVDELRRLENRPDSGEFSG